MSLSGFDRKSAEQFAESLEQTTGPRTHRRTNAGQDLQRLTGLARQLSGVPPVATADEEFRANLRSFLMATAERDGIGVTAQTPARKAAAAAATAALPEVRAARSPALAGKTQPVRQFSGRATAKARVALLIGVAVGAIVLSGVSAASTGALPGDPLYSVKLSTEKAQLALAGSDASRGHLHLQFAESRMAEAQQVDPSRVAGVLTDMDVETKQGVSLLFAAAVASNDPGALNTVSAFVDRQRAALTALRTVDASTVTKQLELLDEVTVRVNLLRRAITAHCPMAAIDQLGPIPGPTC
jgi:hypothetical protein